MFSFHLIVSLSRKYWRMFSLALNAQKVGDSRLWWIMIYGCNLIILLNDSEENVRGRKTQCSKMISALLKYSLPFIFALDAQAWIKSGKAAKFTFFFFYVYECVNQSSIFTLELDIFFMKQRQCIFNHDKCSRDFQRFVRCVVMATSDFPREKWINLLFCACAESNVFLHLPKCDCFKK